MGTGRRLRLITTSDGRLAALIQPHRIVVVALPALEIVAEPPMVVAEPDEVDFLPDGQLVTVVDGRLFVYRDRWRPLTGYGRRPGARMLLTVEQAVITTTGATTMITEVGDGGAITRGVPVRGPVRSAHRLADGRVAFVLDDALDAWDVRALSPARRVRLRRASEAIQIGGTTARMWCVQGERARWIDVLPQGSSSFRIGIGEEIARASGCADGARVAIIHGPGGRAAVLGVDAVAEDPEPEGLVLLAPLAVDPPIEDLAWIGTSDVIVACNRELVLQLAPTAAAPAPASPPVDAPPAGDPHTEDRPRGSDGDRASAHDRLRAWKQRIGAERASAEAQPPSSYEPQPTRAADDWRRELVAAVRRRIAGGGDAPLDVPPLLAAVAQRLDLWGQVLALTYGAYLAGIDGVPPVEVGRVEDIDWAEALGGGRLAATGALRWSRSRVRLAPELRAAFDELPPLHGAVVEGPPVLPHACAVVAVGPDLAELAARVAPTVGSILVPSLAGLRRPERVVLEAMVRDLAPILPWAVVAGRLCTPPARGVIVVAAAADAADLGLPVVPA
jgi:hypothetical protein